MSHFSDLSLCSQYGVEKAERLGFMEVPTYNSIVNFSNTFRRHRKVGFYFAGPFYFRCWQNKLFPSWHWMPLFLTSVNSKHELLRVFWSCFFVQLLLLNFAGLTLVSCWKKAMEKLPYYWWLFTVSSPLLKTSQPISSNPFESTPHNTVTSWYSSLTNPLLILQEEQLGKRESNHPEYSSVPRLENNLTTKLVTRGLNWRGISGLHYIPWDFITEKWQCTLCLHQDPEVLKCDLLEEDESLSSSGGSERKKMPST